MTTHPARHAAADVQRGDVQAGTAGDPGAPRPAVLLWAVLGGALVWSVHFMASYVLVAFACSAGLQRGVRLSLLLVTVAGLLATAHSMWTAWRWWHRARELDQPTDDRWDARMGERTARVSFLTVAGLLLSGLFAIGLVYSGMTLYAVPLCEPGLPR